MTSMGLAKLLEELGELAQVAAKKLARMDEDEHWDGAGPLSRRLEDEIADVVAAGTFVTRKLGLDGGRIRARSDAKLELFEAWDAEDTVRAAEVFARIREMER